VRGRPSFTVFGRIHAVVGGRLAPGSQVDVRKGPLDPGGAGLGLQVGQVVVACGAVKDGGGDIVTVGRAGRRRHDHGRRTRERVGRGERDMDVSRGVSHWRWRGQLSANERTR